MGKLWILLRTWIIISKRNKVLEIVKYIKNVLDFEKRNSIDFSHITNHVENIIKLSNLEKDQPEVGSSMNIVENQIINNNNNKNKNSTSKTSTTTSSSSSSSSSSSFSTTSSQTTLPSLSTEEKYNSISDSLSHILSFMDPC